MRAHGGTLWPRPQTAPLVAAVAVAFSALLGLAAAAGYAGPLAILLLGAPLVTLSFLRPVFGACLAVALVATVVGDTQLPAIGFGGIDVRPPEIIAGVALLGALYKAGVERLRAVAVPLALLGVFVTFAVVATVTALLLDYVTPSEAAQGGRALIYFGLAVVIALIEEARTLRRVFDVLLLLCALTGAFAVAASALPAAADVANALSAGAAVTPDDSEGFASLLRVRMPGLALCYALLLPGIGLVLAGRHRGNALRIVALVLMFAAIVVSFNRNQWVGSILGVIAATVVGAPLFRRRIIGSLAPITALAMLGLSVVFVRTDAAQTVLVRFQSLIQPESVAQSSSIQTREIESELALAQVKESPVIGLGAGSDYGNVVNYGDQLNSATTVHNQYLEIALHYGIPALLVFLLTCAVFLWRGVRTARGGTTLASFIAATSVGAVVAILASSVVAMYLTPPHTTAALAILLGLLLVDPRLGSDEGDVSRGTPPATAPT
jgi:O-antigen ligase